MPPHKCDHDEDFKLLNSLSTRVTALFGMLVIFLFLVSFSAVQAQKARESVTKTDTRVNHTDRRLDVQDEKLRWIMDGILRIENRLEEKP